MEVRFHLRLIFLIMKNSVVINGAPYSNGVITSQAGTTWIDNFSNKIEINDDSGSAKQFSISIKIKMKLLQLLLLNLSK